jgi:hypothetical protein
MAGVLRAAAATVAKASIRSFIFLPSLKISDGQDSPHPIRQTNVSLITAPTENVSMADAALRQLRPRFSRFSPGPVTARQQQPESVRNYLSP